MDNNDQKIGGMEENCGAEEIIKDKNEKAELEEKEGKEEMSSSLVNKSECGGIGTEKKEHKSNKSIRFGGWLPDVLDWIKRIELAQTALSTSSLTFHQFCWPYLHGKMKPRIVWRLNFSRARDNEGNWQGILKKGDQLIPIAKINPPEYIVGFDEIKFEFIDDQALEFLKIILPKLDITIKFDLFHQGFEDNQQIGPISRLIALLAQKTSNLEILRNTKIIFDSDHQNDNSDDETFTDLNNFDQQFPGFIYGLQSIFLLCCTERVIDLSVKWLNVSREDGKPKMLILFFGGQSFAMALIDRIKEEFSQSKKRTNFIVYVYYDKDEDEEEEEEDVEDKNFKIENEETGEILELDDKYPRQTQIIVRHKKGEETRDDLEEQFKRESKTTIVMP